MNKNILKKKKGKFNFFIKRLEFSVGCKVILIVKYWLPAFISLFLLIMQIYVEAMGDSHQMARIPGIKK
jgi:hypothetical protein